MVQGQRAVDDVGRGHAVEPHETRRLHLFEVGHHRRLGKTWGSKVKVIRGQGSKVKVIRGQGSRSSGVKGQRSRSSG